MSRYDCIAVISRPIFPSILVFVFVFVYFFPGTCDLGIVKLKQSIGILINATL